MIGNGVIAWFMFNLMPATMVNHASWLPHPFPPVFS